MFYFMMITVLAALTAFLVLSVSVRDKVMADESVHPALKFIYLFSSLIFHGVAIIATIMAIICSGQYEDENKILNDILKNGTQPKVEYTISNGDTVVTDIYYQVPGDTAGARYPAYRRDSLGLYKSF